MLDCCPVFGDVKLHCVLPLGKEPSLPSKEDWVVKRLFTVFTRRTNKSTGRELTATTRQVWNQFWSMKKAECGFKMICEFQKKKTFGKSDALHKGILSEFGNAEKLQRHSVWQAQCSPGGGLRKQVIDSIHRKFFNAPLMNPLSPCCCSQT